MTDTGPEQLTYVVTGGSSGIGAAAADALAARGARLVLVGRDAARAGAVADQIRGRHAGTAVDVLTTDLALLADVRQVAARIAERYPRPDVLILNAAVARPRRELTAEGFEVDFATNYLSPFLLAALVPAGRVVTVGSAAHTQVKRLDLDALPHGDDFSQTGTYAATKLLNLLFAAELPRRRQVTSIAVDPGFVRTRLNRDSSGSVGLFLRLARPFQDSPATAAATVVRAATDAELTGGHIAKNGPARSSALARDPQLAAQAWDQAEKLINP
jgi:NAD(P)-dependent dehydrogenase (short-subunit alcohol dehydrogenase family)